MKLFPHRHMKLFPHIDGRVIERWKVIYQHQSDPHEILHIDDSYFFLYSNAITYGFLKLDCTHNNQEDYQFSLTEDGEAYITFMLL